MFSILRTATPALALSLIMGVLSDACAQTRPQGSVEIEEALVAKEFVYPVGVGRSVTQARDSKDEWYNAQDFGTNDHLGEDWNGNSGGNTDCGKPVRATADGKVVFAGDAGPGWGNVIILSHRLPDGSYVQSLYGHLRSLDVTRGKVRMGQKIGAVGGGNGRYLCHLHFEIRSPSAAAWGSPGPGYSRERNGWLDPSDFIDARLAANPR